jgi:hypothetical protein
LVDIGVAVGPGGTRGPNGGRSWTRSLLSEGPDLDGAQNARRDDSDTEPEPVPRLRSARRWATVTVAPSRWRRMLRRRGQVDRPAHNWVIKVLKAAGAVSGPLHSVGWHLRVLGSPTERVTVAASRMRRGSPCRRLSSLNPDAAGTCHARTKTSQAQWHTRRRGGRCAALHSGSAGNFRFTGKFRTRRGTAAAWSRLSSVAIWF